MPMSPDPALPERFGRRVAALRAERGWSQTELADRLAMSRTAVSHLEASMRDASERTVIVLAGLFQVEPGELVEGTDYPAAKAERLPVNVARHTEAALQCALAEQDLERAPLLGAAGRVIVDEWTRRIAELARTTVDPHDVALLATTLRRLRSTS